MQLEDGLERARLKPGQVRQMVVKGLHGHYDTQLSIKENITVIHGKNGSGKTSLLHILANLANGDLARFYHLNFHSIQVDTDKHVIEIRRTKNNRALALHVDGTQLGNIPSASEDAPAAFTELTKAFGGRALYLPAFRAILESIQRRREDFEYRVMSERQRLAARAVSNHELEHYEQSRTEPARVEKAKATATKTTMCREWFGQFVPIIRIASIPEIDYELLREIRQAELRVAHADTNTLSSVFFSVLKRLLEPNATTQPGAEQSAEAMLAEVKTRLTEFSALRSETNVRELVAQLPTSQMDSQLNSVLSVYVSALREREDHRTQAFALLDTFRDTVNQFLEGKKLRIGGSREKNSGVMLEFGNEQTAPLTILSSGERQLVALLFSATHLTEQDGPLLIDEPELSLHVDWQQPVVKHLTKFAANRQIIICTHSPEIAAAARSALVEPRLDPWKGATVQPIELASTPTDDIPF